MNSTGKRPRSDEEDEGEGEGEGQKNALESGSNDIVSKIEKRECSICMEDNNQITLLPSHNCSQCKKDSWLVCEICDQNLLSRTCPFCNQDYKAWKFFTIPNQPKVPFQFASIEDSKLKYNETLRVRILCEVLSRSNSAVYRRDQSMIYFSLPKDLSANPADMEVLITSLPFPAERIMEEQTFMFSNSTWDEIEREIEEVKEGDNGDATTIHDPLNNTIVPASTALKWLLQKASNTDDALIFTLLSLAEWETMLADVAVDAQAVAVGGK